VITLANRFFPVRSAVCLLVEAGLVLFSVLLSYVILDRFGAASALTWEDALLRGALVAAICLVSMYFLDLYDIRMTLSAGELLCSILFSTGVVCIGIGLFSYMVPDMAVSGSMYYLSVAVVAVLLFLWRTSYELYLRKLGPRENLMIVGSGKVVAELEREIRQREKMGFRLVGVVGNQAGQDHAATAPDGIGDAGRLEEVAARLKVDRIVVAVTERRGNYPVGELLRLRTGGVQVVEWPEFFEKLCGRIPVDNLPPSYFIFSEGFRKSRVVLAARRVLSLATAAAALVVLSPVLLVVAAAIKIDSPGPVLYRQDRVGYRGRVFRIVKFRSMRQDAEGNGGPRWAVKGDPRVTRVGRFLRMTRLDELPQLWNVLRGDLDLVGPRPERPQFVEQLEALIPYYALRHTVRPGLTGWAQVCFSYCGSIEESREKLQYDLFYIKNMSLKLDLLILLRTVKIVILGRGAR